MTELTIHKTIDVTGRKLGKTRIRPRPRPLPAMSDEARAILIEEAARAELMPLTLTQPSKIKCIVDARCIAIKRMHKELGLSVPELAGIFDRDDASIRYVLRKGEQ